MNTLQRTPLLLIAFVLVATAPWLFFGVQYADLGWSLSKSWMIAEHPEEAFWELSWLSSAVGALWMEAGEYSLLWMRIGFLPLAVLTVLSLYGILRLYYQPRESALALVPAYLLYIAGFEQFAPNYYTVPSIFILPSLYFFLKSFRMEEKGRLFLAALASGIFFALFVQSRIPGLVTALLYIVVWAYGLRRSVIPRSYWWLHPAGLATGFLLGTGGLGLILHQLGLLDNVVEGIRQTFVEVSGNEGSDNIHHPLRLLADTLVRYGKLVVVGITAFGGAAVWNRLRPNNIRPLRDLPTLGLLVGIAALSAYFAENELGIFPPPIGIVVVLFLLIAFRRKPALPPEKIMLLITALLCMVLMNAGSSNNMVGSLKYTAPLLTAVVFVESMHTSFSRFSPELIRLILCVNILSAWLACRISKGDSIFAMDSTFHNRTLQGIVETRRTATEFRELQEGLRKAGLCEGDTTLFYVDVPLLHFTTGTIPFFTNPWISSHAVGLPSFARLRAETRKRFCAGHFPKVVVRSVGLYHPESETIPKIAWLDSTLRANGYDTVWEGTRFIVLQRRKRDSHLFRTDSPSRSRRFRLQTSTAAHNTPSHPPFR